MPKIIRVGVIAGMVQEIHPKKQVLNIDFLDSSSATVYREMTTGKISILAIGSEDSDGADFKRKCANFTRQKIINYANALTGFHGVKDLKIN